MTEDLTKFEKYLRIDPDDLDTCLIEQPEIYYHVTSQHAEAVSVRDSAKLELEKGTAEIDQVIRTDAANSGERITEAAIDKQLKTHAHVLKLQEKYLEANRVVGAWAALKDAFHQRSYMLRELVALKLSYLSDQSVERGSQQSRTAIAESNRRRAADLRESRNRG